MINESEVIQLDKECAKCKWLLKKCKGRDGKKIIPCLCYQEKTTESEGWNSI